jgi:hypothetical protein
MISPKEYNNSSAIDLKGIKIDKMTDKELKRMTTKLLKDI